MSKAWISFSDLSKTAKNSSIHDEADDWSAVPCPSENKCAVIIRAFFTTRSHSWLKTPKDLLLRRILCHSLLGHYDIALQAPKMKRKTTGTRDSFVRWQKLSAEISRRCLLFVWYKCCSPWWNVASFSCQWQRKETNLLEHWTEKMSSDFEIDVQVHVGDLAQIPWTLEHPMMCACRAQGDREGWLAHSSSGACIEENGLPVPTDVGGFYPYYRIRSSPPENERM